MVLDSVQDPGNIGTLLRNVVALNWDAVYLLEGCCDVFNEKAVRASKGALFKVKVDHGPWGALCDRLQREGFCMLAATASESESRQGSHEVASATVLEQLDRSKVALVLGSEGQGVRLDVLRDCQSISIPMSEKMESMNVAAAGSMLMLSLSSALRSVLADLAKVTNHSES